VIDCPLSGHRARGGTACRRADLARLRRSRPSGRWSLSRRRGRSV